MGKAARTRGRLTLERALPNVKLMARSLSHLDARGRVRMVNVSAKRVTSRVAVARGRVFMHRDTLALIERGQAKKGDVISTAHVAGLMAAKCTSEIIPLAHG